MALSESGTKETAPAKSPARSTSSDWIQPDTHPQGEDKGQAAGGSVDNVGKGAGKLGKKGGRTKVW